MPRDITPTYRVEVATTRLRDHMRFRETFGWRVRESGMPSPDALAEYVRAFEASTMEGGVNAHLGATVATSARIVRQRDDAIVAAWTRPLFTVL